MSERSPIPCSRHEHGFDGLVLETEHWEVRPVRLEDVRSSFFDDPERFPLARSPSTGARRGGDLCDLAPGRRCCRAATLDGVLALTRPTEAALADLLVDQGRRQPSYPEVGASRGAFPLGYRHDRYELRVGEGDLAFERAVEGLRRWAGHRAAGVELRPAGVVPAVGVTVVQLIAIGPIWAVAPCRVVYVVDEPDRWGFAYGTLPAHPEVGEESFVVERAAGGAVVFRVEAFSRYSDLVTRVGSPVSRWVQVRTTRRFLTGLASFVGCSGPDGRPPV